MAIPGSPASLLPAGDDEIMRRLRDADRRMDELSPSVAASLKPTMDELRAAQATLAATVADLAAQQVVLSATVANLASRVTVTDTVATFNTGALPDDSTFHEYGSAMAIVVAVPTGKLVVTVGCGQATVASGGSSVIAEATFSISSAVAAYGDVYARGFVANPTVSGGASLSVQQAFTVTPGTYTVTGQMRAWAAGTSTGSVNFAKPFLTVQVTG